MIDLRNCLGSTAKANQLLDVYYTLGNSGKARFAKVEPHQISAKSEGKLNFGLLFKGEVEVDITITDPGKKLCRVTFIANGSSVQDDQATYKEKGPNWLEVYCKLVVKVTLSLYRDGLYSNLKVWSQLGVVPLLHTWTYPLTDVLAAGEVPQLGFSVSDGTAPELAV